MGVEKKNLKQHNVVNVWLVCFWLFFLAPEELRSIIQEVKYRTALQSAKLIRQLRRRDRLCHKLQKNYDVITACLQAVSQKRRKSTQLTGNCGPQVALVSIESVAAQRSQLPILAVRMKFTCRGRCCILIANVSL